MPRPAMTTGNNYHGDSNGRRSKDRIYQVSTTSHLEGDDFENRNIYPAAHPYSPAGHPYSPAGYGPPQSTVLPLRPSLPVDPTLNPNAAFDSSDPFDFSNTASNFDPIPSYDSSFTPFEGYQHQVPEQVLWSLPSTDLIKCPEGDMTDARITPPPETDQAASALMNHIGQQASPSRGVSMEALANVDTQADLHLPRLPAAAEEATLTWMRKSFARHVNPAQDRSGMMTLADAHDLHPLDIGTFVGAHSRAVPTASNDRRRNDQTAVSPAPSRSVPPQSGKDTRAIRESLANEYVRSKRESQCNMTPAQKSPGGSLLCPWAPCKFAHHRHDEWKRHLEKRQPQQVFVCYLCLESPSSGKDKKPSIEQRKDKHVKHLRDAHDIEDTDNHLSFSCFNYPGNFLDRCPYQFQTDGKVCGEKICSWKDQLEHLAAHYKSEPDAQESDGSVLSRSGKRFSNTPQSSSRNKTQRKQ